MVIAAGYIQDNAVLQKVQTAFVRAGVTLEHFESPLALLRKIRRQKFDLLLIDIGSGLGDSESIFSWLNCRSGDLTPVIMLSMVKSPDLVAMALNAGADDFLLIPFEPVEFIARTHALLRRSSQQVTRRIIDIRGFLLDRETNSVTYRNVPIELTPREFTMAWLFFSTPSVYVSRETIGSAIWGTDSEIAGRTIEQHVYKLRKKLQLGPERGVIIRTAYSGGYRLEFYGSDLDADSESAENESQAEPSIVPIADTPGFAPEDGLVQATVECGADGANKSSPIA